MPLRMRRLVGPAAILLLGLGALAGCGATAKTSLVAAADATYAPNEFLSSDGHTVVGMDADLMAALAKAMGLKVKLVNANFASIIPGLAAGKYDIGISSLTDTREREKTLDFVTYYSAGTSFYAPVKGGSAIGTLADLCGHAVAVESGTTQQTEATAQSGKCTAAGKKAVRVLVFPDQNAANLALRSGRADVGMADSPVSAYAVKQSGGALRLVGSPYGTAPYGIALPKGSARAEPLLAALKALIADGGYKRILDKWGVGAGAIADPKINGAAG